MDNTKYIRPFLSQVSKGILQKTIVVTTILIKIGNKSNQLRIIFCWFYVLFTSPINTWQSVIGSFFIFFRIKKNLRNFKTHFRNNHAKYKEVKSWIQYLKVDVACWALWISFWVCQMYPCMWRNFNKLCI